MKLSSELIIFIILDLSIVFIWFNKMVESLSNFEISFGIETFVGNSFLKGFEVIGAMIVRGLYLFPLSF